MPRHSRTLVAPAVTAYGRQSWAFIPLVISLAALTSPLWLLDPPGNLRTKDHFRLAGATVWFTIGVLAYIAGRDWGRRLILDRAARAVSRESSGPWKSVVLWSYPGSRIESVSLERDPQGFAVLQAFLRGGRILRIEQAQNETDLQALGRELADCWDVPFKT